MTLTTPQTRKVYIINGEEFSRKKDIEARCKQILDDSLSCDCDWVRDDKDHEFLHALFRSHPNYRQKRIQSSTSFGAGYNRYGTVSFYLCSAWAADNGGDFVDDISYIYCIRHLNKEITYYSFINVQINYKILSRRITLLRT